MDQDIPDKPVSKKPAEARIGSGKAPDAGWQW